MGKCDCCKHNYLVTVVHIKYGGPEEIEYRLCGHCYQRLKPLTTKIEEKKVIHEAYEDTEDVEEYWEGNVPLLRGLIQPAQDMVKDLQDEIKVVKDAMKVVQAKRKAEKDVSGPARKRHKASSVRPPVVLDVNSPSLNQ